MKLLLAGFAILISSTLALVDNEGLDISEYTEGWYDSGPVLAIEFGEVTTQIATSSKYRATFIIPDEHGHRSIPSSLCITDDGILIGEKNCSPPNLGVNNLFELLNLVDVNLRDEEKGQARKVYEDPAQRVMTEISLPDVAERKAEKPTFNRELLTSLQLSSAFFSQLRHIAEHFLGVSVSQAVVTVPTYLDDHQRTAIRLVGEAAGLEILRVQNRPTIAGVAYEMNDNFGFDELDFVLFVTGADKKLMDLDLVAYEDGVAEILASRWVAYDAHWEAVARAEEMNRHLLDMLNKLDYHVPVGLSDINTVVVAGDIAISANVSDALEANLPDAQFLTDIPADEVVITGAAKTTSIWRKDYDEIICCVSMQPFAFGIEVEGGIFDMFIPRYVVHPVSVNKSIVLNDKSVRIVMGDSMNQTMYIGSLDLLFSEVLGTEMNITFSLDVNVLNVTATVNDETAFVALNVPEYEEFDLDELMSEGNAYCSSQ